MRKIRINTDNAYDILIDNGLLNQCGAFIRPLTRAEKAVIVTDDNVNALYAAQTRASLEAVGFAASVFVFPNGEASKSHSTLLELYGFLAETQVTRADLLIALGGGVVGDLTGFAAASYLRGVGFVQIPTTLLAQTDSSVGGKTGVNIAAGKNLVGAFHQPLLVICDADTLNTLPAEVYADGMAEIIKHGMIYDEALFNTVSGGFDDVGAVLGRSVKVKVNVVERDAFEKGERMKLNFGHTLGHAIERYHNYGGVTHGNAVAVGMAVFTKLAEERGLTEAGTYDKLRACLERYGLPVETQAGTDELYGYCMNDKKRSGGNINIVLCDKIGSSFIKKMSAEEFKEFLFGR